ncbi:MAG: hypothetical protein ABIP71_14710 [Verrucomicrobiota bacterium]
MLIRIFLIIAIVAGLAAAGIGFVKVREKLVATMEERDAEKKDKLIAEKSLASTKKTLKATEEDLTTTKKTLATTQTALQTMTAKADDLDKQKTDLVGQLTTAKGERDAAQQKLVIWENVGPSPDQMRAMIVDLKKTREQKDAVVAENKILLTDNKKLNAKIDDLIGPDRPVPLPAGLKGTVVAVDPKYDFVVLDIGEKQGVLERGEMLVNRRGVLVAKVRITSVGPERSVANILPDWKGKEIEVMEGDQVLY